MKGFSLSLSKLAQPRVPFSPIPINPFLLYKKGLMISASSGSLELGAVAMKKSIGKSFDKNKTALCKCDGWVLW